MNKGKIEYRIHGCIEQIEGAKVYIEPYISDDKADFWGVYVVGDDGLEYHIADFNCKADAELFVRAKETE